MEYHRRPAAPRSAAPTSRPPSMFRPPFPNTIPQVLPPFDVPPGFILGAHPQFRPNHPP